MKTKDNTRLSGMKSLLTFLFLIGLASFGMAQPIGMETNDTVGVSIPSNTPAADIYSPFPISKLPDQSTPKPVATYHSVEEHPLTAVSSHGPAITFKQHIESCKPYRQFNFGNRTWKNMPGLNDVECNQWWSNYLLKSKVRIKTNDFGFTALRSQSEWFP